MDPIKEREDMEIDLLQLAKALLKRIWAVILVTVLAGAAGLLISMFALTPKYTSSVQIYVNNAADKNNSTYITTTEISAAKSLVDTYVVILKSRTTLEEIRDASGLGYSTGELSGMITAAAQNGTQIFRVSVTSPSPQESRLLANTVAAVLPERISEVVDGSSVRILDYAQLPTRPSSPNIVKNTALAALAGFVLICAILIIRELTDTVIHDETYLLSHYPGVPILGSIPDLTGSARDDQGYGYGYAASSRGDRKGLKT